MIDNNSVKRLAIYVIYDKDGIVDDYVLYYLRKLSQNVSHLVIVCNGKLADESRAKLEVFTQDLFVRQNTGFDCGAVKDVLFNLYGWDKVYKYDELLIANDTVYGPFYPFKRIFSEMDRREVDFWGLTIQAPIFDRAYAKKTGQPVPVYVQSYFINVKKRMLHSGTFYSFWEALSPDGHSFEQIVLEYEIAFTVHFSQEGYTYGAYTDSSKLFSAEPVENCVATHFRPLALLRDCGAPCLKKKYFTYNRTARLKYGRDAQPNEIMRFIRFETEYDENLILDNLIRIMPTDAFAQHMNFYYFAQTKADMERLAKEQPRLGELMDRQGRVVWRRSCLTGNIRYYSGIVFSPDEAAEHIADLEYMMAQLFEQIPDAKDFSSLLNKVRLYNIRSFSQKHRKIYLYGAGIEAERWAEVMAQEDIPLEGFVVSDGQPKGVELKGRRIFFLSEITNHIKDSGLILALNPKNTAAVQELLISKGIGNILKLN